MSEEKYFTHDEQGFRQGYRKAIEDAAKVAETFAPMNERAESREGYCPNGMFWCSTPLNISAAIRSLLHAKKEGNE